MRRAGVALLVLVGLAFSAFVVDDLRMQAPPPTHQAYFERLSSPVPQEIRSLVLFIGNAGVIVCLRNMQGPYGVPAALLCLGAIGCALAARQPQVLRAGT
jgi:hypothetical protein